MAHSAKFPGVRVGLCVAYSIISIPFLAVCIYYGVQAQQTDSSWFWIIEFGIGEFVDAIILIMQLVVLRLELKKERPYTPFHLLFSIYLTAISVTRLILVLLKISD